MIVELGKEYSKNVLVGKTAVPREHTINVPVLSLEYGWGSILKYIIQDKPIKTLDYNLQVVDVNGTFYTYDPKLFVTCYNSGKKLFTADKSVVKIVTKKKEEEAYAEYNPLINVLYDSVYYADYNTFLNAKSSHCRSNVFREPYTFSFPYKMESYGASFKRTLETFKNISVAPKNSILLLGTLLNKKSVGLEMETYRSETFLPRITQYGIFPLRDGSLPEGGVEYASVPIRSIPQMQRVFDGIKLLNETSKVDTSCALHVHFGNLPKTKHFYVALFMLYQRLQDELLGMLPHYLKHPMGVVGKTKNYSDKLPTLQLMRRGISEDSIETAFESLYHSFMGSGVKVDQFGKTITTEWSRSWNCASRYVQLNFVNAFSKEDGTVEFRLHPPSLNPQRIYLWISLCAAIILYAEKHQVKILNSVQNREKILLLDVIEYLEVFNSELRPLQILLWDYVNAQTNLRFKQEIEATTYGNSNGGLRAKHSKYAGQAKKELKEDRKYTFDIEYEI